MTLTFTKPGNEAHPAVACRRAVHSGKAWKMVTQIQCSASKKACEVLAREFNALDARMKRAIDDAN